MTPQLDSELRAIARLLAAHYEALATQHERESFRDRLNVEIALARGRIRDDAQKAIIAFTPYAADPLPG